MKQSLRKPTREPTIALINIVFLMLVFFMVAGTLARPLDPSLKLVRTSDLEGVEPADALVLHPDGTLSFRGQPVEDSADYAAQQADMSVARIVPDRGVPAIRLLSVARDLRAQGFESVIIVTERALR